MCGHIGMMGKKLEAKHEDALEDGLFISALRGHDSVGVGVVPFNIEEAPFVQKRLGMAPYYLKLPDKGARVLIGHVRSATIGGAHDRDLAHPFIFDNIIGAHNGTLRGDWRELERQTNERFGSDSQAVFYNFAYWGVEETIQSIYGAWCFVWWDDDEQTLNLLRNDERPLWTARGKDGNLYWASEHWMINGMLRAGEKDRDKLVKTPTADGKEERFFHKLPTNTWRRFTFTDEGEVLQLEDRPLQGKEEPKPVVKLDVPFLPANHVAGGGSETSVYALWRDGKWVETSDPSAKGALRLASSYARMQPSMKGLLYRTMAGETYVSKPGSDHAEVPFKDFIEFHTQGECSCCGTFIEHPIEIGYLADDFTWFACRECVKDWMGVEAGDDGFDGDLADIMTSSDADLAMEMGDGDLPPFSGPGRDPDIDVFGERNKMVTFGHPPANDVEPDPDVEDMIRAIEAQAGLGAPVLTPPDDADLAEAGEAVAAARAAMNPDGDKPKRPRREKLSLRPISDTGKKGVPLDDIPWDDLNDELPVELRDSLPPSLLAKIDEADKKGRRLVH